MKMGELIDKNAKAVSVPSDFFQLKLFLREPQHSPWSITPKHSQTPNERNSKHKLLIGGLGYAPSVGEFLDCEVFQGEMN